MYKISVIICSYTKEMVSQVIKCVNSLKEQTLKPDEIILVLDPDQELVDFFLSKINDDVKILASSGYGLSNARNTGVQNCEGDIVVFIDDDAVASKKWLENLVKNYVNPNVVGTGGLSIPVWQKTAPMWFPEELYWIVGCSYSGLPKEKAFVRNPIGCNMSFRKKVFKEVGYFQTEIGRIGKKPLGDEETEFSIRVLEKIPNSKIVYDPEVVVYHSVNKKRTRLDYVWARSFYEGIGKAIIQNRLKSSEVLVTENLYIKYLLGKAIPSKIRRIYRPKNFFQLFTLFFSTVGVFSGFFVGTLRNRL